ncbi:MAG: ATP-dependent zinc metalloprotease FtsH [Bacteroidota bacterium]
MAMTDKKKKKFSTGQSGFPKFNIFWIYVVIMLIFVGVTYFSNTGQPEEIDWSQFKTELLQDGEVNKIIVVNEEDVEVYLTPEALQSQEHSAVSDNKEGPQYTFTIGSVEYFQQRLEEAQRNLDESAKVSPRFEKREDWFSNILSWVLPIIIIIAIWMFIMRRMSSRMGGGGGGNPFANTGKSKAKLFEGNEKVDVDFNQVAGLDEAKEEVMEVVDFLKHDEKYKKLGAKIPKGVLLTGPPGTGKTLMAKAMAGESGVPFFSISGSDFVEMFVGVGAARVRDLFKKGREKAPCIIFIDEIEAIGRSRGRSNTQTNDERENTLNQLLVEMDGFSSDQTVIILAATNRPDLLDKALLRPGRFDRQIQVDKPDANGRRDIFKVHLKKLTLGDDIDPEYLAKQTPGFAGAEIANICNEAALHAARKNKEKIEMEDFISAIDRVIGGMEKKNKLISPKEKKIIAYHETGHAVTGWLLEHAHPLLKVSIIPRGEAALGFAQYLPKEQNLYTYNELKDTVCMTLGGRVMEEIVFGDISSGAQNDLEKTTQIAYAIIALYGMNKKVGPFSYKELQNEYSMRQPYSEQTANMIDEEARAFIDECYQRTKELLEKYREDVETIAQSLMEKEVLYKEDFVKVLGERDFDEFSDD